MEIYGYFCVLDVIILANANICNGGIVMLVHLQLTAANHFSSNIQIQTSKMCEVFAQSGLKLSCCCVFLGQSFTKLIVGGNRRLTVAVTLSQSDTKALNPSPNTAPAVLKANIS